MVCGLISITFFVFSCNSEKQAKQFEVKLDVVVLQNDSIRVFYKKDGSINFNEDESFWTKVIGSNKNQKITLLFPKKTVPNQFRIDFGTNQNQPEIILNKIECVYKNKSLVLKGKEIYLLMRVDENNTILEKDLGILKRKNTNQKNGPSLYPIGDKLKLKLEELTKISN